MNLFDIENVVIENEKIDRLSNVLCNIFLSELTPREAALFIELYDGYSQQEIAHRWNITIQAINLIHISMKKKVGDCLVARGFSDYVNE